ncbi:LysR family transcriptional regulator [Ammoniphilus sp. CFH 90114]|uniref:LysR family transcriptional regulator n=1 Tax=Ammoniphilus sp. CFH 90114 TaxID=2493665 RepID=UPI00100DBA92|nr:LysR family transcriptional regulator [Ammoniphilus sp. CFH 90114]RXT07984.1 LysR family transcriptional regulator [Ammoniphilus sp. CFH 90114]
MDLQALKVFQTVVKAGSITRAAQELNYAQSNVTTKIQQLETMYQTTLFYRHNRGITLTTKGQLLLGYVERISHLIDETEKAMKDDHTPKGPLRLGSMETTAAVRLPRLLSQYHHLYPDVDLSLVTGPTEQHVQGVLQYELDGAFVAGPIDHPDLIQKVVIEEKLVLITDKIHPPLCSLGDIRTRTLLVFRAGCSYRAKLQQWMHQEGIIDPKIMEFGTLEAILGCVSAGLGVSLLPFSVIEKHVQSSTLTYHSIPEPYSSVQTLFIRRKDAITTTALARFMDMMSEAGHESID